jgi:carboxylesterase
VTHRWFYGLRPETWARIGAPAFRWVYKGNLFRQVNRKEDRDKILSYQWTPVRSITMLMDLGRRVNEEATLDAVACPVLLIHSRRDSAASPKAAENAVRAMPAREKTVHWLSRSNHIIFWDHERDEVARAVLDFLAARAPMPMPGIE